MPGAGEGPFGRMRIAQVFAEGLAIVKRDKRFGTYGVALLPT